MTREMTKLLAIAAVAVLAISGPANAQGVANFFAGFSAGLQQGMQAPYAYVPPYVAPPPNPYVVPQPVYQNYRFPNGRALSCVTVMMNTTCN